MIPRLYWTGHYLLRDGEGGFEYLPLSMILFYFKEKEKARGGVGNIFYAYYLFMSVLVSDVELFNNPMWICLLA